jgi:hypothetical protein
MEGVDSAKFAERFGAFTAVKPWTLHNSSQPLTFLIVIGRSPIKAFFVPHQTTKDNLFVKLGKF